MELYIFVYSYLFNNIIEIFKKLILLIFYDKIALWIA
jgi:hypothetical protein